MLSRTYRENMKKKTAVVSIRVEPELKKALEAAAEDDSRSVASMLEKLMRDGLKASGHLPSNGKTKAKR
jgi:hypothetical protein